MGHNEKPAPYLACASFERREQARFDAVAQFAKVCEDLGGSQGEMSLDVLEEAPLRPDLIDDAPDVRPEVARIVDAAPLAGEGERLARISSRDEMNLSAPRPAVEGDNIVPDRRAIQRLVFHPRHESGRSEDLPLDVTDSAISGFRDMEAELQSANACAESDAGKSFIGMYSHTSSSLLVARGDRRRARLASDD